VTCTRVLPSAMICSVASSANTTEVGPIPWTTERAKQGEHLRAWASTACAQRARAYHKLDLAGCQQQSQRPRPAHRRCTSAGVSDSPLPIAPVRIHSDGLTPPATYSDSVDVSEALTGLQRASGQLPPGFTLQTSRLSGSGAQRLPGAMGCRHVGRRFAGPARPG